VSEYKKSKRTALTWDQEYKPRIDELRDYLDRGLGAKGAASNLSIFMLCLGVGFQMNKMRERPARKSDGPRLEYIMKASEELATMRAVALAYSKDYETLLDEDKVFDIVEEYAAGGLEILCLEMDKQADFNSWLTTVLYEQMRNADPKQFV